MRDEWTCWSFDSTKKRQVPQRYYTICSYFAALVFPFLSTITPFLGHFYFMFPIPFSSLSLRSFVNCSGERDLRFSVLWLGTRPSPRCQVRPEPRARYQAEYSGVIITTIFECIQDENLWGTPSFLKSSLLACSPFILLLPSIL